MTVETMVVHNPDEWQDVGSRCFVPLRCQFFQPGFRGRMEHIRLDAGVSVSFVTTDGLVVERTPRLAARAGSDDIHISLQVQSTGWIGQGGSTVAVRPGTVTVYATDAPYVQNYSRPAQRQLIIQASRAALDLPPGSIDAAVNRLAAPSSDAADVLFGYARGVFDDDDPRGPEIAGTLRDLAATMIRSSVVSGRVMPKTSRGLLATIDHFVANSFSSPDVTVDAIAEHHHISRRRLYQLFEESERHPAEVLRDRRLDYAETLLVDPGLMTVREVAARAGFVDTTTFARGFRRRHGMSPREFRLMNIASARD